MPRELFLCRFRDRLGCRNGICVQKLPCERKREIAVADIPLENQRPLLQGEAIPTEVAFCKLSVWWQIPARGELLGIEIVLAVAQGVAIIN